jgi:hypothetical protein
MEINDQRANKLIQPKGLSKACLNGFEQALNSLQKQKTGDEYYRYHQQQLELSDLQFNPLGKETEVKAIQGSNADSAHHFEIEENNIEKAAAYLTREPEAEKQIQSASGVNNILEQYQSQLKQEFAIIANQTSSNPQLKSNSLPTISYSENKALSHTFVFKEHQLFIQGKEAEFSLNSTNLTRQQSEELSQLVKEWLRSKGIKLHQLIINGVKQ